MRPAIARAMLNSAVKRGDLSRPPECSRCGRSAKIARRLIVEALAAREANGST